MKNTSQILIKEVYIKDNSVVICFNIKTSEKLEIEAWIESKNKYNPYVFYVSVDKQNNSITIPIDEFISFVKYFPNELFRISLCTSTKRLNYEISRYIEKIYISNISIVPTKEFLFFISETVVQKNECCLPVEVNIQYKSRLKFDDIRKLPVNILNIGSCFSRSIFRTDEYFNPTYKKYFHVKKTLFHNSFISLFSKPIDYNFYAVEDLNSGDAALYTKIEFLKDIDKQFMDNDFKLIVIDNYIDATSPIVKYNNSFLTYNRYLAESIFKRLISPHEIIYPGTEQHMELYRKSIISFRKLLIKYNIKNIVLIGGRQSKYKINEKNNQTYLWDDKMEWILNVNKNWDKVDKIFLDEMPETIYIDKRNTYWKSDIFSPILGGASPSHYQSAYYKELFYDIISLLEEDLINEQNCE